MTPLSASQTPDLRHLLQGLMQSLRPSERLVAQHILDHEEECLFLSAAELASAAKVSKATVLRLVKACGLTKYAELRVLLAATAPAERDATNLFGRILPQDDIRAIATKTRSATIQAIEQTASVLDYDAVEALVAAVSNAKRVHLYGVGSSGLVAMDAQHKLMRVNVNAWAFTDPHIQSAVASQLDRRDVAIGVSFSGHTKDVVESLSIAKEAGAITAGIVGDSRSPLAKVADIVLRIAAPESIWRSGAVVSRVAQIYVVDLLTVAIGVRNKERTQASLERQSEIASRKRYRRADGEGRSE